VACDEAKLNEYLISKTPDELEKLGHLRYLKTEYDLSKFIAELEKAIEAGLVTENNIEVLFDSYKALAKEESLEKILSSQEINTLLGKIKANTEGYYDLVAMRLAGGSSFPIILPIAQTIVENPDEKLVGKIVERIEYFTSYGQLLLEVVDWPQPLLIEVTKELTLKPVRRSRLAIAKVLPQFESICEAIDVPPETFITRLDSWSDQINEHITGENIAEIITDVSFYQHAIELDCALVNDVIQLTEDYINSCTIEDWSDSFTDDESHLFNVTYWLLRGKKTKTLPNNALSAYKQVLKEIANGDFEIPSNEKWSVYYEKSKTKLKPTIKDIRDSFINELEITVEMFLFFFEMLVQYGDLKSKSADVTRRILTPIADNDDCLSLIIQESSFIVPIIKGAKDDADDFKDVIRLEIEAQSSLEGLSKFAKQIGVK